MQNFKAQRKANSSLSGKEVFHYLDTTVPPPRSFSTAFCNRDAGGEEAWLSQNILVALENDTWWVPAT